MKNRDKITGNLISGGAMFGLSIFILQQTSSFSSQAATFPRLLSFVLLALSTLFIASTIWGYIKNKKSFTKESEVVDSDEVSSLKWSEIIKEVYPFSIIILCILFITALNTIGFELSASILILATMALIDRKEAVRKFYIALIVPVVLILIFKFGIGLRLPLLLQKFFE